MSDSIVTLAAQAGFLVDWQDAHGKTQRVPDDTLAALLKQIGLPCDSPEALRESFATLQAESPAQSIAPLITGTIDRAIVLDAGVLQAGMPYTIRLEHGGDIQGVVESAQEGERNAPVEATAKVNAASSEALAAEAASGIAVEPAVMQRVQLAAVQQAGYHQLEMAGHQVCLAIAPVQCFSVADALGTSAVEATTDTAKGAASNPARKNATRAATGAATNAAISARGATPTHGAPHIVSTAPRLWGLSAQVYGVRRNGDGGVGDFTSLAVLARESALSGASALAISPMHAMFSADPGKCSPYSPSSRLFVNVLHVDPEHIFGATNVRAAVEALNLQPTLSELESAPLIDWPSVADAKLALLRYCFDQRFIDKLADMPEALSQFREAGGTALEQHARFEALHAYRVKKWLGRDGDRDADHDDDNGNDRDANANDDFDDIADARAAYDWRYWPKELQDPDSAAVAAFVAGHRNEVDFHIFLQWLADCGLANAQQAARDAGMPIGLIADLAVGCDSAGSQTWSQPSTMLQRVSVGAPPDLFNQAGQAWGLTTFSPRALRTQGFRPFTEMVRHAFAHAGGIRVDHILGLRRLWLVPEGESARKGAYLYYPVEDLLRLLALESWRHRAVVIGEDLGTVPPGLREQLAEAGLLGMRVLWFEREPYDASSPSGGAIASAPGGRRRKTAAAQSSASGARTSSKAHTTADEHPERVPQESEPASAARLDKSVAKGAINQRADEDNESRTDKHSANHLDKHADKGIDQRPDKRSDIAAITDLSDIGELDELTDIRGMVSLSDEVDDLFSNDDDGDDDNGSDGVRAGYPHRGADTSAADTTERPSNHVSDNATQRVSATAPSPQAASARDTFIPPQRWSADAIAMTTTHDLPTIAGWWDGQDIVWRQRIGQSSSDEGALRREQAERLTDRALLWRVMIDAGVVPAGSTEPADAPVDAILRLVAMTAAPLALFPMEDILGLEEQPNLPGSTDEHPNWRRRLPFSLEHIKEHGAAAESIYQRWKLIDTSRTASQLGKKASAPDPAQTLAARMRNKPAAETRPPSDAADSTDGTGASPDARSTTRTRSPT
jgi:4-alpha-glucanotransferase